MFKIGKSQFFFGAAKTKNKLPETLQTDAWRRRRRLIDWFLWKMGKQSLGRLNCLLDSPGISWSVQILQPLAAFAAESRLRLRKRWNTQTKRLLFLYFFVAPASHSRPLSALCRLTPPASIINHNSRSPPRNVGKAAEHDVALPGGGGDIHQTHAATRPDQKLPATEVGCQCLEEPPANAWAGEPGEHLHSLCDWVEAQTLSCDFTGRAVATSTHHSLQASISMSFFLSVVPQRQRESFGSLLYWCLAIIHGKILSQVAAWRSGKTQMQQTFCGQ